MTVATIVCLTATLCVNPALITSISPCGDATCIAFVAQYSGFAGASVPLPIAEVLRLLDQGPVAVTFVPEPKT